jgi:hypothetical protein
MCPNHHETLTFIGTCHAPNGKTPGPSKEESMKKLLAVAVAMSAYACVAFAQGSPDLDHLARLRAEGIGVGTPVVPIDLIFGEGIFVAPVTVTGQMQGETLGKAKFEVVFSALGSAAAGPLVSGARTTAFETAPSGFCGWGTAL